MVAIVDCNSFYCSCERVFRPELENQPVAVLSNNDGCIISLSNETKQLGIGMAAPYYKFKNVFEQNKVHVFSSNYNLYGDLSRRVMDTLKHVAGEDKVEVYSVDEAFVDLGQVPDSSLFCAGEEMQSKVEQWTGIKVSVGIAPTKVLSKLANRLVKKMKLKPAVMVLDSDSKIIEALQKTSVEDIWGVGRRYAGKLKEWWGIENALQLRNMNEEWARKNLGGVVGVRLIRELRGIPCMPMKDPLENKLMIATTRMFGKPVTELNDLREAVASYTSRAAEKLRRQHSAAKSIDVFVVTNDYEREYQYMPQTIHTHCVLPEATSATGDLIRHAVPLVEKLYRQGSRYLKTGVTLGGLVPDKTIQANLFVSESRNANPLLMQAMDNINYSMREDAVKYVASGLKRNWKMRQELISGRYTSRWNELKEVH
ncbi:MAG TPA: Y-family DNA polymerase [Chitinophagaceae bacterium]|nr:Y-family DNA polymerase [Chitinophagaceae bacterium]